MKLRKKLSYFSFNYSFVLLVFIMAFLSYYTIEHPDAWSHQDTHFKRMLGYYIAPYLMVIAMLFPLYAWFKFRSIEVNLVNNSIKLNGKLIDISAVNEIYKKHISFTDLNEYTFYQVVPMEYRKLLVIPMFFIPDSKEIFAKELNDFCIRNKIKLVDSKMLKKSDVESAK